MFFANRKGGNMQFCYLLPYSSFYSMSLQIILYTYLQHTAIQYKNMIKTLRLSLCLCAYVFLFFVPVTETII